MLRKNFEVKWTDQARHSFQAIKEAIITTPVLINPNFDKDFI